MFFLGVDWAEQTHDICLIDERGKVLGRAKIGNSLEGLAHIHALVQEQGAAPESVVVGIESDRGLIVNGLIVAGYLVYAINPLSVNRYRDRHSVAGAKSDAADAKLLADLVRTDRDNHRPVAGDSAAVEVVKLLARAHEGLIQSRRRQVNQLRTVLQEFYPAALKAFSDDVGERDSVAILEVAPTPAKGRSLTQARLVRILRKAGRQRYAEQRAAKIYADLQQPELERPPQLALAYGMIVSSSVKIIRQLNLQLDELETEVKRSFELHPSAEIYLSLPGFGLVVGARVLGEFGDDPERYEDAKARRAYSGVVPITVASGRNQHIVKARFARNRHLVNALTRAAFCSLSGSPGCRAYYDALRSRGKTHQQALRALANRLVGILHGCLRHHTLYSETLAWPNQFAVAA